MLPRFGFRPKLAASTALPRQEWQVRYSPKSLTVSAALHLLQYASTSSNQSVFRSALELQ